MHNILKIHLNNTHNYRWNLPESACVANCFAHLSNFWAKYCCRSFSIVLIVRKCFSSRLISGVGNFLYTVCFSATTINLIFKLLLIIWHLIWLTLILMCLFIYYISDFIDIVFIIVLSGIKLVSVKRSWKNKHVQILPEILVDRTLDSVCT